MKKLSTKTFINWGFALLLLSLSLFCIYQNMAGRSIFRFCRRLHDRESVWKGNAYGDLSAYSVFLKGNLFKGDFCGHILVTPGLNRTNLQPFYSFRPDFPSFYLSPVEIEIDNDYEFVLEENVFNKLNKLPLITKMHGETYKDNLGGSFGRRFCLVRDLEANDYKKWAIYGFSEKTAINIFTLPMDWQGLKDGN